jgi:Predicted spermidine synthase with an N-terminal membrane domain
MYHVFGTCLTVSILYFLSFCFYRAGFYSLSLHRKIWNLVLAITMLFVALTGVFMALQVNYKWNIPFIKQLIKWHVEIGVGSTLICIFHFSWHFTYFRKLFSASHHPAGLTGIISLKPESVILSLLVTGFTTTSVQVLFIREMMNITGGYELITGVFLGSWLISSSAGAAIAGKSGLNDIRKISLIFSATPFISLLLMLLFSRFFLARGETPSFLVSLIFTLIVLLPFCLVSGFLFIKLLSYAWHSNKIAPGKSYSTETIGAAMAGVLVTLLASGILNTYQLFLVITLSSLVFTLLTFYIEEKRKKLLIKIVFAVIISLVIIFDPDILFRQVLLPGLKVIDTKDTPYGNITKGSYAHEPALYYNQRLLAYNDDAIEREEDIHYALLQRPNPENVIIISGNLGSHLPEIEKYHVKTITFLERDPELVKNATESISDLPENLTIENEDAFRFIREKGSQSDVIILLLAPPSTLSLNRFYTREFFEDVKKRLTHGGVFMCSPGPGDDYLNRESLSLYSSIYNSLAKVFRFIKPVLGNKLYFIASDEDLSVSFCSLLAEHEIKNIYVSPDYLSDDLIEAKSKEVLSALIPQARLNSETFPVAAFHFQAYNLSRNISEKYPALVLLLLVFALPVLSVRRRNMLMYFSASALAGFEIIMLLALQLTAGNMYQLTGLFLAVMMAGLAAGSGVKLKFPDKFSIRVQALFLTFYYAGIGIIFSKLIEIKPLLPVIAIIILAILLPSFMTGHLFRELTNSVTDESNPSSVYSADLAGSAMGFILVAGILVPLLGIKSSLFFLSVMIFAGFLFGTNRNKS